MPLRVPVLIPLLMHVKDFWTFLWIRSPILWLIYCLLFLSLKSVPCFAAVDQFKLVTLSSLHEIVDHLKPSGSPTDPVPPRFCKEIISVLWPWILVNNSLYSGVVPTIVKHATVQPLFKKPGLDPSVPSNFGPISMPFLSKSLEKIAYNQMRAVYVKNDGLEGFSLFLRVFMALSLHCRGFLMTSSRLQIQGTMSSLFF